MARNGERLAPAAAQHHVAPPNSLDLIAQGLHRAHEFVPRDLAAGEPSEGDLNGSHLRLGDLLSIGDQRLYI